MGKIVIFQEEKLLKSLDFGRRSNSKSVKICGLDFHIGHSITPEHSVDIYDAHAQWDDKPLATLHVGEEGYRVQSLDGTKTGLIIHISEGSSYAFRR